MGIAVPSIDVLGGRAVRLRQGQAGTAQEFGDPLQLAEKYCGLGFGWLHVVDLDAAFGGLPQLSILGRIASECPTLFVQWAGGVRSLNDAELSLSRGAARVVFGTALALSPGEVARAVREFGRDRVWAALDFSSCPPLLKVKGWTRSAGMGVAKAAGLAKAAGVGGAIVSSIDSDGMERGPNLELVRLARKEWDRKLWAAGGMGGAGDAKAAFAAGADGAIFGKALYRKETDLEGLKCLQGE